MLTADAQVGQALRDTGGFFGRDAGAGLAMDCVDAGAEFPFLAGSLIGLTQDAVLALMAKATDADADAADFGVRHAHHCAAFCGESHGRIARQTTSCRFAEKVSPAQDRLRRGLCLDRGFA